MISYPREMVTFVAGQVVGTVVERLFARKIVQVMSDAVPTRDEHRDRSIASFSSTCSAGERVTSQLRWRSASNGD